MKIESHLENLKESITEINQAVQIGVTEKQRSLGFHTSAASIDILEIILHKENKIDPGFVLKHDWFNSDRKIKEKIPFDFPKKEEIVSFIKLIENSRNNLCYGKRQSEESLEALIKNFNKLREIFIEVTKYEL